MAHGRQFQQNYKRDHHPIVTRAKALWRVLTCRNIILVDFFEITDGNRHGVYHRSLYHTNYNSETESNVLGAVIKLLNSQNENNQKCKGS